MGGAELSTKLLAHTFVGPTDVIAQVEGSAYTHGVQRWGSVTFSKGSTIDDPDWIYKGMGDWRLFAQQVPNM